MRPYRTEDESSVLALWKAAFHKDMDPRLWQWKYLKNPFGYRILLCVNEEGAVIALYGGIPYKADYEGQCVDIINLMDLMSHPCYRGEGLFVRTGMIYFETYCRPDGALFLYGFPGEHHFVLGEKYLGYRAMEKPVIFLTGRTADMKGKGKRFGGRIERLWGPDPRLNALWERCRKAYPMAVIRDERFVRWRFFSHPFQEYEIYAYGSFCRKDMRACAAFVVEEQKAFMVDLFAEPLDKGLSDFYARLAAGFHRRGIVEMQTWFPESHFITEQTVSAGFQKAPEPKGVISTVRLFDHSPSLKTLSEKMFYTMADVDLF